MLRFYCMTIPAMLKPSCAGPQAGAKQKDPTLAVEKVEKAARMGQAALTRP